MVIPEKPKKKAKFKKKKEVVKKDIPKRIYLDKMTFFWQHKLGMIGQDELLQKDVWKKQKERISKQKKLLYIKRKKEKKKHY